MQNKDLQMLRLKNAIMRQAQDKKGKENQEKRL